MTTPGTPTLDQLQIFLAIVDTGSFAGAGRKLNRAVSVISYGIGNLEAQLGVMLFDREGTRKPQLTEAGRAVLAEIRSINNEVDALRAKVESVLKPGTSLIIAADSLDAGTLDDNRVLMEGEEAGPPSN